jgi:hypothetical protein
VISDDLIKRIKILAKEKGITTSALFNQLAKEYVESNGKEKMELLEKRVEALEKEVFKK